MTKDILQMVREEEEQANRNRRRACIICPGAIGDCLLTLPLASLVRSAFDLGGIDFIGRTEYIDFYPGRTCIDTIKSLESIDFHRLFEDHRVFTVEDHDRLIGSFAAYEHIISFMGAGDVNFETNFIFTLNCSHPAEVTLLPLASSGESDGHVSEFYIRAYLQENQVPSTPPVFDAAACSLRAHAGDAQEGRRFLEALEINPDDHLAVIHPGSGGRAKCWHVDNFRQVARRLVCDGIQVLFLYGPVEMERMPSSVRQRLSDIAPCLSGGDLAKVLQVLTWADVYLGNDSGISHLAASLGKSTLAIFGPTDPRRYRPLGPRVTVLTPPAASFMQATRDDADCVYDAILRALGN
ncbi:MAG: glycosyltransferase family 9 protein [Phycisphaerae bacterium]|nr:glycosyltransferase family 9 protein [Phycisphaerae bacterium]